MTGRQIHILFTTVTLILIVKANNAPHFTGTYPVTVTHDEGSATPDTTVLHTFTATDADAVDVSTLSTAYVYDPTSSSTMFAVSTSGAVTLASGQLFDYESGDTFKIYATAYDGTAYSDTVLLTIKISDVNESPYLSPATPIQSFTISEGIAGTVIGHPSYTVLDPDFHETFTWSVTGGTGAAYLLVNTNNGSLTLKTDYDRDTLPASVYVDVQIQDKNGLSTSTIYNVSITDVNDIDPVFTTSTYSITASMDTAINTEFFTAAATDGDAESPNNDITYNLQSDNGAEYFALNSSTLYLAYQLDVEYGQVSWSFLMYAIDGGSPARTATATITVTTPPSTTTESGTTTTDPPGSDFFDYNLNLIVFAGVCLLSAVLIGFMAVMCWRKITYGKCLPDRCKPGCTCFVDEPYKDDFEDFKRPPVGAVVPSNKKFTEATQTKQMRTHGITPVPDKQDKELQRDRLKTVADTIAEKRQAPPPPASTQLQGRTHPETKVENPLKPPTDTKISAKYNRF